MKTCTSAIGSLTDNNPKGQPQAINNNHCTNCRRGLWLQLATLQEQDSAAYPCLVQGIRYHQPVEVFVNSGNTLGNVISPALFRRIGYTSANLEQLPIQAVGTAHASANLWL